MLSLALKVPSLPPSSNAATRRLSAAQNNTLDSRCIWDENVVCLCRTDLGHPRHGGVPGHDSQGEAAVLVQADHRWLRGRTVRQLHHLLEGREVIQCHHS